MAFAFPTTTVSLCLGGSFRQTLIDEDWIVGTWPLAELISMTAKDISDRGFHGTYTGTGFTRGVQVDLPEGGFGLTFDGNGYIEALDDADHTMSLDGGDMDIVFLIKTTTNDATLRAIVQKMETNSAGHGWYVALQNGNIQFLLRNGAGLTLFNTSHATNIADGSWHLVHCCYMPHKGVSKARIGIDGGALSTGANASIEGSTTTANLRIGTFADGAGDFIGSLAYVAIGREGDPDLGINLQATRTWTTISGPKDIRGDIDLRVGNSGTGWLDHVASPGTWSFSLNNGPTNSARLAGYYSPDHANCRSGFTVGIPARLMLSGGGFDNYRFHGTVSAIHPMAGTRSQRLTEVTVVDWMQHASTALIAGLETQVDTRSSDVVKAILDASDRPPINVAISSGSDIFPFALDNSKGDSMPILQELHRAAISEWAYTVMRGSFVLSGTTSTGGNLIVEARGDRQLLSSGYTAFSDTMDGLELDYADDAIVNKVNVTVHPRETGSAGTTLWALQDEQKINSGETITLKGQYVDSTQRQARVGALVTITPVATTDYTFNDDASGDGADFTSDLDVEIVSDDGSGTLGANGFEVRLTNNNAKDGHLITFKIRGTPLYTFNPLTVTEQDGDSIRQYGERPLNIDMVYQTDTVVARSVAMYLLSQAANLRGAVRSISYLANANSAMLGYALSLDVGYPIQLTETQTGMSSALGDFTRAYWINEVEMHLSPGRGEWRVTYGLSPANQTPAWTLGSSGASELDETTVLGV